MLERRKPLNSPCLWASSFHSLITSLSFSGICKVRKLLLKLSMMKCWDSASNAQGSRGIIVAVQIGAVKIYVTVVEALKKKRRTKVKLRKPSKLIVFWVSSPVVACYLCTFVELSFWISPLFMTKLRVLVLSFLDFRVNSVFIYNILGFVRLRWWWSSFPSIRPVIQVPHPGRRRWWKRRRRKNSCSLAG